MFVISSFLFALAPAVDYVLGIYVWVLVVRVLITWVNPDPFNPVMQILSRVSDPYLNIFRRFIPPIGRIDLSPWVAIMALGVIQKFLYMVLMQLAYMTG